MNLYVMQHIGTGRFIYSETPKLSHTERYDNALQFKETVIEAKKKQYKNYRCLPYQSLGNVVSKY